MMGWGSQGPEAILPAGIRRADPDIIGCTPQPDIACRGVEPPVACQTGWQWKLSDQRFQALTQQASKRCEDDHCYGQGQIVQRGIMEVFWSRGDSEIKKGDNKKYNSSHISSIAAETVLPLNELTVQKTKEDENIRKYSLT